MGSGKSDLNKDKLLAGLATQGNRSSVFSPEFQAPSQAIRQSDLVVELKPIKNKERLHLAACRSPAQNPSSRLTLTPLKKSLRARVFVQA